MSRIIDGLSIEEISNKYGESKNNVTVILSRIRTKIFKIVNDERFV